MSSKLTRLVKDQLDFTQLEKESIPDTRAPSVPSLYFLTNRNNLLDILSSGMIKPAAWYSKYYPDLGQYCPGAITLLKAPPSRNLVQSVIDNNDAALFPVLVEVNPAGISGSALLIKHDFSLQNVDIAGGDDGIAIVTSGVIPISAISVVHFRSLSELKEHQARKYANISTGGVPLYVNGSIFQGDVPDDGRLIGTLQSIRSDFQEQIPTILPVVDSLCGMLLLLGKYISNDNLFPLNIYLHLARLFAHQDQMNASDFDLPPRYGWISYLPSFFHTDADGLEVAGRIFRLAVEAGRDEKLELNNLLIAISIQHTIKLTPKSYSPDSFINSIQEIYANLLRSLAVVDAEGEIVQFNIMANLLLDVRSGLVEIDDLFARYPTDSYPACAALFLFMSENRPENMMVMVRKNSRFQTSVLAIPICLSAALYGKTLLPSEVLPSHDLCQILDDVSIFHINKNTGSIRLQESEVDLLVTAEETPTGVIENLTLDRHILISRPVAVVKPELSEEIKMDEPKIRPAKKSTPRKSSKAKPIVKEIVIEEPTEEIPANLSSELTARVSVEKISNYLMSADLTDSGSPAYKLAIEICRHAKWADQVITWIPLKEREYVLENRSARQEIRIPGFVLPEYRFKPNDEFKSRLGSLGSQKREELFKSDQIQVFIKDIDL